MVCPTSVRASPKPLLTFSNACLPPCFIIFFISPLYKLAPPFTMFSPKLSAFSVLLATLRPPICSNPAERAAPATAVA